MIRYRKLRSTSILAIMVFFTANFKMLLAQSQLEFSQDLLYADSMFLDSNQLHIHISLYNNSSIAVENILITYTQDSTLTDTLFSDASSISPKGSFDTFIVFNIPTNFLNKTIRLNFVASTSTFGVDSVQLVQDAYFENVANPKTKPKIENYKRSNFKRFKEYLPIEFDLSNDGNIDFFVEKSILVNVMVNDNVPNIIQFKMPHQPLLANGRNSIKFKDSILVSDALFVKGGENIVVVWPVGFLQVDSIFDTLTVDWPMALANNKVQEWYVFPNPANIEIHIIGLTSAVEEVRLIDIKGSVIVAHVHGNKVSLPKLSPGVYTLWINQEQKVLRKLIMITN